MERSTLFADVIVPLAVPNLYTYRVPYDWNDSIRIGQRVIVQFGKKKLYTALVRNIHQTPPKQYEAKYLDGLLDTDPIVTLRQLELWDWMAGYYMCCRGEIMNAALPSGLKLSSETKIILHPEFINRTQNISLAELSDKEYLIVEALELRNILTIDEVSDIIGQKTVHAFIKDLIEKGIVLLQEELKEKYKPKKEDYVRLSDFAEEEDNLKEVFDKLERKAHKQLELLLAYIKLSKRYSENRESVKKSELLKASNATLAVLNQLIKKEIFEMYSMERGGAHDSIASGNNKELNEYQVKAYHELKEQFMEKEVALLHGVTSSGKTELYIKLIEETIAQGKQVLYLLPEIALTAQIINRLRKHFGENVAVYHSKFNENERVEIWNSVLKSNKNKEAKIVLGARSAIFLPFDNLGLIIVDEEHDVSYKQFEPSPRYNARDTAIYLAHIHKAKTVLGSATPSVESFFNASEKKYGYIALTKRFGDIQMPEIVIADVKEEKRKKLIKSIFSTLLLENIKLALENKEQVILFQNRRGFAPLLECQTCAWTPQCIACDVSLTYHKKNHLLRCHYCGYSINAVSSCSACGDTNVKTIGFGTEKIEEELSIFFPAARIGRMDYDTTRSKYSHQQIIQDFEDYNIDILVGTQMVTKGLDFDNVSTVGILNADSMMNFPDFRSFERSFQLMAQVSGRAGRKSKRGKVIIQTHNPSHFVIQNVISNDYESMYQSELIERKNFLYPPFYRLIRLTFAHKEEQLINNATHHFAEELRKHFGKRVLGPEFPLIARVRGLYRKNILLKIEKETSVNKVKQILQERLNLLKKEEAFKMVRVLTDVDPM